jgi:hypothetical protein
LSAARANKPVGNVDLTQAYQNMPTDVPDTLLAARRDFRALKDMGEVAPTDRRDFLEAVKGNITAAKGGSLYKVDLPDEAVAKMLDYDNAVPEAVRQPISKTALNEFGSGLSMGSGEQMLRQLAFEFKSQGHPNPNAAASEWLRQQGIPGVRYLDGGSRGAGQGTANYVIFPGEEGLLQILERNGQPL